MGKAQSRRTARNYVRRQLNAGVSPWVAHEMAAKEFPHLLVSWSYVLQLKRELEKEKKKEAV